MKNLEDLIGFIDDGLKQLKSRESLVPSSKSDKSTQPNKRDIERDKRILKAEENRRKKLQNNRAQKVYGATYSPKNSVDIKEVERIDTPVNMDKSFEMVEVIYKLKEESPKNSLEDSSNKKKYILNNKYLTNMKLGNELLANEEFVRNGGFFREFFLERIKKYAELIKDDDLISKLDEEDRKKIGIKIEASDTEKTLFKKLTENYLILDPKYGIYDLEKLEESIYKHLYEKNEDPNIIKFYSFDVEYIKRNNKSDKNGKRCLKEIVYKKTLIKTECYITDNPLFLYTETFLKDNYKDYMEESYFFELPVYRKILVNLDYFITKLKGLKIEYKNSTKAIQIAELQTDTITSDENDVEIARKLYSENNKNNSTMDESSDTSQISIRYPNEDEIFWLTASSNFEISSTSQSEDTSESDDVSLYEKIAMQYDDDVSLYEKIAMQYDNDDGIKFENIASQQKIKDNGSPGYSFKLIEEDISISDIMSLNDKLKYYTLKYYELKYCKLKYHELKYDELYKKLVTNDTKSDKNLLYQDICNLGLLMKKLIKDFTPISKITENNTLYINIKDLEYIYKDICNEINELLKIKINFEHLKENFERFKESYYKFDNSIIFGKLGIKAKKNNYKLDNSIIFGKLGIKVEKCDDEETYDNLFDNSIISDKLERQAQQCDALNDIYNFYFEGKNLLFILFNILKTTNIKYNFLNKCKEDLVSNFELSIPKSIKNILLNLKRCKDNENFEIDKNFRTYLYILLNYYVDFINDFDIINIENNIIKPYTDSIEARLSKDVKNYIFILIYKNLNALKSNYAFYDTDVDFKISNGTALNRIYELKEKIIDLEKDAFRLEKETLEVLNMPYNEYKGKFNNDSLPIYKSHCTKIVYYILMKNIFKDGRIDSKYMIFLEFINSINSISLDLEDEISDKAAILKTILDELYKEDSELSKDFENLITYSIIFNYIHEPNGYIFNYVSQYDYKIYINICSYLKSRLSEDLYEEVCSLINLDIIKNPNTPLKEQLEAFGIEIEQDDKKNIISAEFEKLKNGLKSKKETISLKDFENILESFGGNSLNYSDVKYIKNSLKNDGIKENDYFSFFEEILRKEMITDNIIRKYISGIYNKMNNFLNLDIDNLNYQYPTEESEINLYAIYQSYKKDENTKFEFKENDFTNLRRNLINLDIKDLRKLEAGAKNFNEKFNKYIVKANKILACLFMENSYGISCNLDNILDEREKRLKQIEQKEKEINKEKVSYNKQYPNINNKSKGKYEEIQNKINQYFDEVKQIKIKPFENNQTVALENILKQWGLIEITNISKEISKIEYSKEGSLESIYKDYNQVIIKYSDKVDALIAQVNKILGDPQEPLN